MPISWIMTLLSQSEAKESVTATPQNGTEQVPDQHIRQFLAEVPAAPAAHSQPAPTARSPTPPPRSLSTSMHNPCRDLRGERRPSTSFEPMDTVSLLLNSPRGRFFCATVGYACSDDERASHYRRPQTPGDALEVLGDVDVHRVGRLPELDLLAALGFATDFARYWQPPDEEDLMFARPEIVAALRPIARATLASPHTLWWNEPVDLTDQRCVEKFHPSWGWSELPLRIHRAADHLERWRTDTLATERRFLGYRTAEPDRNISGEWWSTPVVGGTTVTSRARDCLGAVELLLDEDDNSDGAQARVWPVRVRGTARVYEITAPADWAHLVDAYPLPVPASRRSDWYDTTGEQHDWFIPDWAAVAADYDAVHLTVVGYLTTPGIAIPLATHSGATVLAGWNPDATFWLRNDFLSVDDDPTDWRRYQDDPWAPA